MNDIQIHTVNEMIAFLAPTHHVAEIARKLGVTYSLVSGRLKAMGITCVGFSESLAPTEGEWIGCVMQASSQTGIPVRTITNPRVRRAAAVKARWLAYRICLDTYPQYSIAGLARTVGISHASIMHGLGRLAGLPAKKRKESRTRASGRRPEYFASVQQAREAA